MKGCAIMKRFVIVDFYEGAEFINDVEDREEACDIAIKRYFDTDGECDVDIFDLTKKEDREKVKNLKFY